MTTNVSKFDHLLYWLYYRKDKIHDLSLAISSGFLLGRITNELSIPYKNWSDILSGLFSTTDRPANAFTWLALPVLLSVSMGRYGFIKYYKSRQFEKRFVSLVQQHKDSSIAEFNAIGWNSAISLQTSPELHRGWQASEVRLAHNTVRFSLPEEYKQQYQEYHGKYFEEKNFRDDKVKIMLTNNPVAFSDSPTLKLKTRETLYSEGQFYHDNIAIIPKKRNELIRNAINGLKILFPHSLCLHIVIVTSDDEVLITKRSKKVSDYPGKWSCSIEERMTPEDIAQNQDEAVLKWFERSLKEELGLGRESYNENNLRVLSVFLESDILNISVCAHATLNISTAEMKRMLEIPRIDYEFDDWKFLTHKKLLDELFYPDSTRPYHPTSGYRMLMALIKRHGEPWMMSELFSRYKK